MGRPAGRASRGSRCWRPLDIANDDFIRTTERAPHASACSAFLQDLYDDGRHLRGRLRGPVLRRLRGVQAARRPGRRRRRLRRAAGLRDPRSPGRAASARRTTSSGCPTSRERLLELYDEHPEFVQPESARNEVIQFVRQGLTTCRSRARRFDWGIQVPWDDAHVVYVWFDALLNYVTAVGLRRPDARRAQFAATLARRRPPRRQGHPAVPRGDLAGDADGRRARAAAAGLRARLAAGRRREDEQVEADRHRAAADHRRTSAPTRSATTSCARSRSGRTARSPGRTCPPATTRSWPTASATWRRASSRWSALLRRRAAVAGRRRPGRGADRADRVQPSSAAPTTRWCRSISPVAWPPSGSSSAR